MKKTNWLLFIAAAGVASAQGDSNGVLGSGSFTSNGFKVAYVTRAEPASPGVSYGGGFRIDGDTLHRVEVDNTAHTYFGYDLKIEAVVGTMQCRTSIGPLSQTAEEIARWFHQQFDTSNRAVLLPKYPAPQTIDSGDTIALDLLTSADGRQKVVDYLQITCGAPTMAIARVQDSLSAIANRLKNDKPRDLSLDDIEMHLSWASISINGKVVPDKPRPLDSSGPLVWFGIPGKGRFVVSLAPRPGYNFVKAGSVQGDRLNFEMDGDRYEIKGAAPLLRLDGNFSVYVLRDAVNETRMNVQFGVFSRVEQIGTGR